jgi:hypothetical protein
MISRRGILTGLVSLVAAPAIVRVTSIMPVKVMEPARIRAWMAVMDLELGIPAALYLHPADRMEMFRQINLGLHPRYGPVNLRDRIAVENAVRILG